MFLKEVKNMAEKEGKKISKDAIKKINRILKNKADKVIKMASRNADFAGRKVIKVVDVSDF